MLNIDFCRSIDSRGIQRIQLAQYFYLYVEEDCYSVVSGDLQHKTDVLNNVGSNRCI